MTSPPGSGATFRVAIPRDTGTTLHAPSGSRPTRPLGRLRMLVVDDEDGIRKVLQHVLSAHDVTVGASGKEAIALCDAHELDCVVCSTIPAQCPP